MDEDGCDSRRIRFFWYFAKITSWWNVVKPWTIDIGLWYYQEDIRKNPMKEQELNKDIFSLNR